MGQVRFLATCSETKGLLIAPKLSPIKSRFAVGSADAFTAGYTQSELMVVNKGFMSEQEKDNQVAVSSLFTQRLESSIIFFMSSGID
jgi:hypothetical protein